MRSFDRPPGASELRLVKLLGYPLVAVAIVGFGWMLWSLQADARSCREWCQSHRATDHNWVPAQAKSGEAGECRCAFGQDDAVEWRVVARP